jgi:hypothetical protein
MNIYKLEVYVFDYEGVGLENIISNIEGRRYLYALVKASESADIGHWSDDHILNKTGTPVEVFRSYFGTELKSE